MEDGKAENTCHKMHGTGQPQQLPELRELKEHWDLTDISDNWTWHPLQELILMETLKEVCGNCFT